MVRQRRIHLKSNLRIPSLSKAIAAARLAIALCWCGADQPHALQATSPGGSDASELSGKIAAAGLTSRRGRTGSGKDIKIGGKSKNKTPVRSNEKEKRSWGNDNKKITKANPILRLLPPVQRLVSSS